MAEIYVATTTAVVAYDGGQRTIRKGTTRVEEGHELLELYPQLFEPAADGAQFKVRSAKADPVDPPADPPTDPDGADVPPAPSAATETPQETPAPPPAPETPAVVPEAPTKASTPAPRKKPAAKQTKAG